MKHLARSLSTVLLVLVTVSFVFNQDDPNPNSPIPRLVSGSEKSRLLAVKSSSFDGTLPKVGSTIFKTGSKLVIFLSPTELQPNELANAFRVFLNQRSGKTFELQSNDLSRTRTGELALSISVTDAFGFHGQPEADGDSWIYVTWRGLVTRPLKISLGHSGGDLPELRLFIEKAQIPTSDLVGYRWSGDRTRFLEQATFGPSTQTDERLRRIGPRIWLAEQFEAPYPFVPFPTPPQMPTVIPTDCMPQTNPVCYRDHYSMVPLQQWFFKEAMYGNAQLRLRTAWALSQIWVTSGVVTQQSSHAIAYQEALIKGAFGNYRDLMSDLTLNPTMGNYLDMVRSTRANPNENYPREILQLFSVGLYMLNQDGTPKLDGQGNPIPTFDQDVINDLSRVFTGWKFCSTANCSGATPGVVNYRAPMVVFPSDHDLSAKTLLNYPSAIDRNISACSTCTSDSATADYAKGSLDKALNNIFNHPNVGPYIGKLLIQHLVTSDPSPAYVSRVAAAFNDSGNGTRGDMKAVLRAILLDPEARGDIKTAPRYGKLREPVQLMTNLARIFPARDYSGQSLSDGALNGPSISMGQNPFNSPTVFNYFLPDYIVPGTTILAPEFEIFNMGSSVKRTNLLHLLTIDGITSNATDSLRGTSLDYTEYVPYSSSDVSGNQLMDILKARMMHGTMTAEQRNSILTAVQAVPDTNPLMRVKTAVYLIACSSQYQIQR